MKRNTISARLDEETEKWYRVESDKEKRSVSSLINYVLFEYKKEKEIERQKSKKD